MGNLVSARKVTILGVSLALLALAAFLIASQFSSTAAADKGKGEFREFIGLWVGADPSDGGTINVSITENDDGDLAEVYLAESYVSICDGGRALVHGLGSLAHKRSLEVPLTIECLEDPSKNPPNPIPVVLEAVGDSILELTVPVIPNFTPISVHKVSVD